MDNKTERKVPGFGKIMLASGVGTLIVLVLIGLFKLLVFFGILGSIGSDSGVVVAKDSFLKIDLTQPVNERTPSTSPRRRCARPSATTSVTSS